MSTAHIIQSVVEGTVFAAIIFGFVFEPKLAAWEEKHFPKLRNKFSKFLNK